MTVPANILVTVYHPDPSARAGVRASAGWWTTEADALASYSDPLWAHLHATVSRYPMKGGRVSLMGPAVVLASR